MKNFWQRMAFIFPMTFMCVPFIHMFFEVFNKIRFFLILEYLYPLLFFYLGATISYGLRKLAIKRFSVTYEKPLNKYGKLFIDLLPYLLVTTVAFILRDSMTLLYPQITEMSKSGDFYFSSDQSFRPFLTFIFSAAAGMLGAFFANFPLNDYLKRKNVMLYISVFAAAFIMWILTDMLSVQGASMVFSLSLALFLITFFYVRNIILINIKLGVYTNDEIQNTSITIKNRSSYMTTVALTGIVPVAAAIIIVPLAIKALISFGDFLLYKIAQWFLSWKYNETSVENIPEEANEWIVGNSNADAGLPLIIYIIVAFIILYILYRNRSVFKKLINFLAQIFKYKTKEDEADGLVLYTEEITSLEREKKKRRLYRHMTYGKFLRMLDSFGDNMDKYAFAYGYIFWNIVDREKEVEDSHTPREMTAIMINGGYIENYAGLDGLTYFYEDVEYGIAKSEQLEQIPEMLNIACNLVKTARI